MKKMFWIISLLIGLVGFVFFLLKIKYIVKVSENCDFNLIFEEGRRTLYFDSLEEIKIRKSGKTITLQEAFKNNEISLEELLKDAKKKEEGINGVHYYYDDFSIYVCQKINEDHVMPNNDVIFGRKDFNVDFTKHCR